MLRQKIIEQIPRGMKSLSFAIFKSLRNDMFQQIVKLNSGKHKSKNLLRTYRRQVKV